MSLADSSRPTYDHFNTRWPTMIDGKRKAKKRNRNFTPADRAAHRVFEKSRREAFNDRLLELARSLPALSSARRLSKHTIVDESIVYHKTQNKRCLAAVRGIRALLAERDELLAEVNSLRAFVELATFEVRVARGVDDDVLELLRLEGEFVARSTDNQAGEPSSGPSDSLQDNESSGETNIASSLDLQQSTEISAESEENTAGSYLCDIQGDFGLVDDLASVQPVDMNLNTGGYPTNTILTGSQPMSSLLPQQPSSAEDLPTGTANEFCILDDPMIHLHYSSLPEQSDQHAYPPQIDDLDLVNTLEFSDYVSPHTHIPIDNMYMHSRDISIDNTLPLY
ncbi:hypothetical protein VTN77DRAFT_574 [Rasamsonia byssochlamydoides]|uniref:uncharacterized protein n=1 Tax=Rasamsonia byssochlamydoides TaxID=89139 RepID=UPI003742712E